MNSKKEKTKEHLIKECELSNQSINWWKNEMEKVLDASDKLDKEDPLFLETEKRGDLEKKMTHLIKRGKFEVDNLDFLENKINNFFINDINNKVSKTDTASEQWKQLRKETRRHIGFKKPPENK